VGRLESLPEAHEQLLRELDSMGGMLRPALEQLSAMRDGGSGGASERQPAPPDLRAEWSAFQRSVGQQLAEFREELSQLREVWGERRARHAVPPHAAAAVAGSARPLAFRTRNEPLRPGAAFPLPAVSAAPWVCLMSRPGKMRADAPPFRPLSDAPPFRPLERDDL
jgi:hypothetical protein